MKISTFEFYSNVEQRLKTIMTDYDIKTIEIVDFVTNQTSSLDEAILACYVSQDKGFSLLCSETKEEVEFWEWDHSPAVLLGGILKENRACRAVLYGPYSKTQTEKFFSIFKSFELFFD